MRVAGFVNDSITDGPGFRFTLFLQGCKRGCPGCHNPDTWDPAGGSEMGAEEIFEKIARNPLLSGVTFSGGEPFLQAGALLPLARKIKAVGLELAVYTGYTFEELLGLPEALPLMAEADVLVDGPFVAAQKSLELRFRGSANQRILDLPASLQAGRAVLLTDPRWTGELI